VKVFFSNIGSGNEQEDLQLRQYVPDSRVIGHSANIAELDAHDDDEEYELASEKKSAR
jgi:hypothetical protein